MSPPSFSLHRMVRHRSIPGVPESLHLFGKAEGYANVSFEKRITGSDERAPSSEHVRDLLSGPSDMHQDKIGMGIECTQHTSVRLIEEFLAIVRIERGNFPHIS